MKRLILALCLLCLTVPVGAEDIISLDDTVTIEFAESPDDFIILYLDEDNRVIINNIDLLELLKRCREFVRDPDQVGVSYSIYYDHIQRLEREIERIKRLKQLRQDIETIIKHLGEVK